MRLAPSYLYLCAMIGAMMGGIRAIPQTKPQLKPSFNTSVVYIHTDDGIRPGYRKDMDLVVARCKEKDMGWLHDFDRAFRPRRIYVYEHCGLRLAKCKVIDGASA